MSKTDFLSTLNNTTPQIQFLQSLVRTPSPNPPGDTTAATRIITDYLHSQNIPYDLISPDPSKPNIVSEFNGTAPNPGDDPSPRIVLNGHIDTFPVDPNTPGWSRDPYSGDYDNGRIHGRGVVDMKSGTASLVLAYAALYANRQHLSGSVALCVVSDEETGGKYGTKHLLQEDKERWGGDVMLSAEPSGMSVRFSEKGTLRMSGVVACKGAHGAYLNLSEGAIRIAMAFLNDVVQTVESIQPNPPSDIAKYMTDPEVLAAVDVAMGPGTSRIIGKPTVNIGTIKGGVKVNMIPDHCEFELDIRLPVGLLAEEVLDVINEIIADEKYASASIELRKQEAASNPASFSTIDHPVIDLIKKNAEDVGGSRPAMIPSMGATDCKHYRYAGIPAYVYGCSPLSMASVNESASVDESIHVTKVHALTVWDLLAG
ncbi:hypothetical protein ASPVEDRAFT_34035 [Aspergillus versicolor CBS 583.65]|uniref:Peptidase M20 dimerisation domain-containing protein n=1 Tax=Aspergillus versicolor CBS 583.65 TaxID=1036611 RepID=A0A1L9Q296_ASPVE|nr:uncharacterized protein ASPVEDRAFT_34035 [Aspergillus versicolor CBS 583.65]OJJ07858.1 hypothetical protein ASPVEDRAFT_34035 [Aspergillus versicolor CBS 583.65]